MSGQADAPRSAHLACSPTDFPLSAPRPSPGLRLRCGEGKVTPLIVRVLPIATAPDGLILGAHYTFIHDHVHHARRGFRQLQKKHPRLLRVFREAFLAHAIVHHRLTYADHVTTFRNGEHQVQVDTLLQEGFGRRIKAERYGVTLTWFSAAMFFVPLLPVAIPSLLFLPSWSACLGFLTPIVLYPLMSKVIHPYLHRPYQAALDGAPWLLRLILRTPYLRAVWRHHWLHHRYQRSNFNLLLGGDWLRGVARSATVEDQEQMRTAGMPL